MKAIEVHKLSDEEIQLEAQRLRKRLFELRTQAVTEKIADTSQFKKVRKDIARVLTEVAARRRKSEAKASTGAKAHAALN
jgi:large subunit ribosomal protein L29